ncbi:hypothetical protein C8J56DRAFT_901890 [Mycena floridula]|nr:hypothetical protein C8J56DRAFT_901890 [Mycena floridula]
MMRCYIRNDIVVVETKQSFQSWDMSTACQHHQRMSESDLRLDGISMVNKGLATTLIPFADEVILRQGGPHDPRNFSAIESEADRTALLSCVTVDRNCVLERAGYGCCFMQRIGIQCFSTSVDFNAVASSPEPILSRLPSSSSEALDVAYETPVPLQYPARLSSTETLFVLLCTLVRWSIDGKPAASLRAKQLRRWNKVVVVKGFWNEGEVVRVTELFLLVSESFDDPNDNGGKDDEGDDERDELDDAKQIKEGPNDQNNP